VKLTVTTNKQTRSYEIAEAWDKLSTLTYQRIIAEWDRKDLIRLFSIMSGIEYAAIATSDSEELEDALLIATKFVFDEKPDFKSVPVPEQFTLGGKTIKIPKKLGRLSIGQNIHVRQRLAKSKTYDELISFTCAVYLQPLLDEGDFNLDRVEEIEKEILTMPITQTYPVGFFLLSQRASYGMGWRNVLSLMTRLSTASAQALQRWLSSSALNPMKTSI